MLSLGARKQRLLLHVLLTIEVRWFDVLKYIQKCLRLDAFWFNVLRDRPSTARACRQDRDQIGKHTVHFVAVSKTPILEAVRSNGHAPQQQNPRTWLIANLELRGCQTFDIAFSETSTIFAFTCFEIDQQIVSGMLFGSARR